jgi:hypothetical protein
MKNHKSMLSITPQTKVGELLEALPHLEKKLLELSPKFGHLKNPVLRRTVARIATLQQAAQMAGITVETLVNTLRKAVGQDVLGAISDNPTDLPMPAWVDVAPIHVTFDVTPLVEAGEHPLGQVMEMIRQLPSGKVLVIVAPFYPAPLADMAKEKGLEVYARPISDGKVNTYFYKG